MDLTHKHELKLKIKGTKRSKNKDIKLHSIKNQETKIINKRTT